MDDVSEARLCRNPL